MGAGRELLARGGIAENDVCDSTRFPWLPGESFADRYLRLGSWTPPAFAGRLPPAVQGVDRAAHLLVSPEARRNVETVLEKRRLAGRRFMVMHPGCRHATRRRLRARSGTSKYWPEERWAEVLRGVRERCPEQAVVFTGTRPESRLNADIIRRARLADVHNVAGQLSLPELIALLEQASSVISVDTGPAHAAAALRRPTVALFGTADPELYRPGGATTPAVALTGHIDGTRNILGLTPESVIAAWCELTRADEGTDAPGASTTVCSAS
jgi:heptosyltransferase-2/heptosyltransferase-3